MNISAKDLDFKALNDHVRSAGSSICIDDCCGQRFIACGAKEKKITINGTPGNALGAYLDGASIELNGNAQDAVGDTMNDGKIIIHGNAGDALGYSMRGGSIFVRDNAGYRTGIHMKEYKDKKPVIVIGGTVGSFLGEYLAGGTIIVLGIGASGSPVGNFTGTGMHGGRIYIRTNTELAGKSAEVRLPEQVKADIASANDMNEIAPYLSEFAEQFGMDAKALMEDKFYLLTPNTDNPYERLYSAN